MKKKGFTLVELLVVIAIIALLMGILMPALARVRQIAYRLYCGTNLSGIGKAILIYANDYDDEIPAAGVPNGNYGELKDWQAISSDAAYGSGGGRAPIIGNATISSCFFLLIKYADVTPKSFLCKGDVSVNEFKVMDSSAGDPLRELVSFWDFDGPPKINTIDGRAHSSYAYATPFGPFAMTTSSDPGMALAADPNPWLGVPDLQGKIWSDFLARGSKEQIKAGNAATHQDDGQNVLYVDGHTSFEKESYCGVDLDNIYTKWSGIDKMQGLQLISAAEVPENRNDSLLISDGLPMMRQ